MIKKVVTILIISLFVFCPVSFAQTENRSPVPSAKIVYVENTVILSSDGQNWTPAKAGMAVSDSTQIKTVDASYCDIALDQDLKNIISVGPNSNIAMGAAFKQVKISTGRVFSELRALAPGSQFQVVTPQAIAGVRGTAWETVVGTTTQFNVKNHTIYVQGTSAEGKENEVPEGNSIVANERGDLGPVGVAAKEDMDRMGNWSNRIVQSLETYRENQANDKVESYDGQSSDLFAEVMQEEMAGDPASFASFDENKTLFIQTDFEQGITGSDITQTTFLPDNPGDSGLGGGSLEDPGGGDIGPPPPPPPPPPGEGGRDGGGTGGGKLLDSRQEQEQGEWPPQYFK